MSGYDVVAIDILSALKREDSHGTAPLGWDIVVCSCPTWTATGCANQPVLLSRHGIQSYF